MHHILQSSKAICNKFDIVSNQILELSVQYTGQFKQLVFVASGEKGTHLRYPLRN